MQEKKVKKEKKNKKQTQPVAEVKRFNALPHEGLSKAQIDERIAQGLVNKTGKKYSKTYKSIFIGNICTFFNFLCLLAALALAIARAPFAQFTFIGIYIINIIVGIVQEIRAKRKIDKLTVLTSPTAKAVRGGKQVDIPVEQIVVDDILILTMGQQVPADCIAIEGTAELNESLLTGESVPIKKEDGDFVDAGSFVASGRIVVRVDKVA